MGKSATKALELVTYPHPALSTPSDPVAEVGSDERTLAVRMAKVLKGQPMGVGLAANQVGVTKRVIVLKLGMNPSVVFNPVITARSNRRVRSVEGCLSLPGLRLAVARSRWVNYEGLNISGERVGGRLKDQVACILQHEIDHLNGRLILDTCMKEAKAEAREWARAARVMAEAEGASA